MKIIIAACIATTLALPATAEHSFAPAMQTAPPAKSAVAKKKAPMAHYKLNAPSTIRDLEAEDKMGNFEIQDLMSSFNQSQTLASDIEKKKDDTKSAIIGKI